MNWTDRQLKVRRALDRHVYWAVRKAINRAGRRSSVDQDLYWAVGRTVDQRISLAVEGSR